MARRGWATIGIGLLGSSCALDDRVVDTQEPTRDVAAELPGEVSSAGATAMGGPPYPIAPPPSTGNAPPPPAGVDPAGAMPEMLVPPGQLPPATTTAQPMLRLAFGGDGAGSVEIRAAGSAARTCSGDCLVDLPAGTPVTFSATPRAYSSFVDWSAPECGSQPQCSLVLDPTAALSVRFQLAYNVAFVSSRQYAVNELPAPGEDMNRECARLAAAAGVHGQRWVAWVGAEGPTSAIEDDITPAQFLQNPGGWVRSDGAPLLRTRSALFASELMHPLNLTETRAPAPFQAWSGMYIGGTVRRFSGASDDCANWTSTSSELIGTVSNSSRVGIAWTGINYTDCTSSAAIQCFGDDPAPEVPVPVPPAGGRLVFAASTPFTPGGGRQAADALCQRDACAAGLTGSSDCSTNTGAQRTFLSYLNTSQQPARARFDVMGATWFRPDGVQWLPDASNLADDASASLSGMDIGPDGAFLQEDLFWVGRNDGANSCADWSSTSGMGQIGSMTSVALRLSSLVGSESGCDQTARVLCLER